MEETKKDTSGTNVTVIIVIVIVVLIIAAIIAAIIVLTSNSENEEEKKKEEEEKEEEKKEEKKEEEKEPPGYYLFAILYTTTIYLSVSTVDKRLIYTETLPPYKFSGSLESQISYNGEKLFYNPTSGEIRTVVPDASWLPLYIKKKSGYSPPFDHALTSENGRCDAIISSNTRESPLIMCSVDVLNKGPYDWMNCNGTQSTTLPARYFLYYSKFEN